MHSYVATAWYSYSYSYTFRCNVDINFGSFLGHWVIRVNKCNTGQLHCDATLEQALYAVATYNQEWNQPPCKRGH